VFNKILFFEGFVVSSAGILNSSAHDSGRIFRLPIALPKGCGIIRAMYAIIDGTITAVLINQ
jgi:hypothetical protein